MRDLRPVADGGVLKLHKVAHLDVVPNGAARADIGERPHVGAAADDALIDLGGVDLRLVSHGAVPQHGAGADDAVPPDGGLSPQDAAGQHHGSPADGHPGINIHGGGVHDPHAALNVPLCNAVPELHLQLRHGLQAEHRHPAREQLRRVHPVV